MYYIVICVKNNRPLRNPHNGKYEAKVQTFSVQYTRESDYGISEEGHNFGRASSFYDTETNVKITQIPFLITSVDIYTHA